MAWTVAEQRVDACSFVTIVSTSWEHMLVAESGYVRLVRLYVFVGKVRKYGCCMCTGLFKERVLPPGKA